MKIKSFTVAMVLFVVWNILTGSMRNPNNPPTGRTGAPGETTCGAAGCHSGGSFTGTVAITGVPDTIVANQSYPVTLTQTSNATRGGFELTCLDSTLNAKCGTLTAGSGTSVATSGGRQYVRQSSPKNLSGGSVSWSFSWKAPASITGNKATFYFVSLAANGNGGTSGDKVLIATKHIVMQPTVAAHEPDNSDLAKLYPGLVHDVLHIDLAQASGGRLAIFDMQGKEVMYSDLAQNNQLDVSHLKKGVHIAQIEIDGKLLVKKFVIE